MRRPCSLDFRGEQWPKVLKCFAKSPDGRTASKADLFSLLYLEKARRISPSNKYSNDDDDKPDRFADRHRDADKISKGKEIGDRVRKAMASLSKNLRKLVECTEKEPFQGKASPVYQSAFRIGVIVKGDRGRLRFEHDS